MSTSAPSPAATTARAKGKEMGKHDPAPLNLSALTAEDAGTNIGSLTGDPYKRLIGTPFEQWVRETHETNKAKKVTVPTAEDAKRVAYLLRLAAKKAGLGVRVPEPFKTDANGQTVILFQGKARSKHDTSKLRKPSKQRKGETREAFRARVAAWEAESGKTWTAPRKG